MGNNTTGVTAILAGKHFVGVEQDPVYFEYVCRSVASTSLHTGAEGVGAPQARRAATLQLRLLALSSSRQDG